MATAQKWTVALLALILLTLIAVAAVLVLPSVMSVSAEATCEADGGQVMIHNFSGRKLCDKPPYLSSIGDVDPWDYWLED